MRSLFKGVIGFGLVSIPVELYKALDPERVTMHWLHRPCGSRIRYQRFCPTCDAVVENHELAKAAELPDGRLVIVDEADEESTMPDKTITIVSFHPLADVNPVYYGDAYWLKPGGGGLKAYRLLVETMEHAERVAVAEMRLRKRSQLGVIRPFNGHALMLHAMHFPESLRAEGAVFGTGDVTINDKERKMADLLVGEMSTPFIPEEYPNQERAKLLERIQALAPVAAVAPPTEVPSAAVLDLMSALKASVGEKRRTRAGAGE